MRLSGHDERRRYSQVGWSCGKCNLSARKCPSRGASRLLFGTSLDWFGMPQQQIVGLGGAGSTEEETRRLLSYVVGLPGKASPRVCIVSTAAGDDADAVLRVYGLLPTGAVPSNLPFFPWPPDNLRDFVLEPFAAGEAEGVEAMIKRAADACECWLADGIDPAMSRYNG